MFASNQVVQHILHSEFSNIIEILFSTSQNKFIVTLNGQIYKTNIKNVDKVFMILVGAAFADGKLSPGSYYTNRRNLYVYIVDGMP